VGLSNSIHAAWPHLWQRDLTPPLSRVSDGSGPWLGHWMGTGQVAEELCRHTAHHHWRGLGTVGNESHKPCTRLVLSEMEISVSRSKGVLEPYSGHLTNKRGPAWVAKELGQDQVVFHTTARNLLFVPLPFLFLHLNVFLSVFVGSESKY
jgi:hypothetical protein